MIWSPLPRVAKAASSTGYQTQHFFSSLSFCVAAQCQERKHSLMKRHKPMSPLCQNRDHYGKQKIPFWRGHVEWILEMLHSFYKIFGGCPRKRKNRTRLSMCDTQQCKILSVTHAGWSRKYLSLIFSLHIFHLNTWQKKVSLLYLVYFRPKKW